MSSPIVEARALRKTYDTGAVRVDALRGVDLVLEQGEMVAIMGPSGCGKTTLLNCLSGLDSIDGGEALIEGTPLSEMSDRERTDYRARRMGFVFQFYNLIPVLTAVENVELPLLVARVGGGEARERALAALDLVGLAEPRTARAGRALGRRASARHDRPLARQRPGHRLGRRADRRPRLGERRRDRRADAPAQPRARAAPFSSSRTTSRSGARPTGSCGCSTARSSRNNDWRCHMYSRVTLLEIDTMRVGIDEAAALFRERGRAGPRRAGRLRGRRGPRHAGGEGNDRHLLGHGGRSAGCVRVRHGRARALRDDVQVAARARVLRGGVRRHRRRPGRVDDEGGLRHPGRHAPRRPPRRPRRSRSARSPPSALRNRILVKLAVRSVRRRRGRSALIVVGLMLGTTIIAAALTTGDTMSHTIRSTDRRDARGDGRDDRAERRRRRHPRSARRRGWHQLGRRIRRDHHRVGRRGAPTSSTASPARSSSRSRSRRRPQGQSEPSVVLFAGDPARMDGFSPIRGSGGETLSLGDLRPREVYLNTKAGARAARRGGDPRARLRRRRSGRRCGCATSSGSTAQAPPTRPLLMSLDQAQRLFGREGEVKAVLVSNRGGDVAGAALSDEVVALLQPVVELARARDPDAQGRTRSRTPTPPGTRSWPSSRRSARSRSPRASS